jgi:hypothetical protein
LNYSKFAETADGFDGVLQVERLMVSPKTKAPQGTSAETTVPVSEASAGMSPPEATLEQIDDVFKELKTLLAIVEKLQKAREDVQDMKPLLLRLLDGELLSGDELEHVKAGLGSLSKLVKLYADYQVVLENAQPARILLDQILKS